MEKTINERLKEIQQTLKVTKSQFNSFGKYNYRSCEDILEAVKKVIGDATITMNDEMYLVGDRIYVKATVTLSNADGFISTSAFAREALNKKGMDEAQITGAASSYARKYALSGLFCIDDNKDPDASSVPHTNGALQEFIDDKQLSILLDSIKDKEVDEPKFLKYMAIDSLEQMPKTRFKKALEAIKAKGANNVSA